MNHEQSKRVLIYIPESIYSELVELLDTRIKSERARARAFRCRHDEINAFVADQMQEHYLVMRNTFVQGYQAPEVDRA